MLPVMDVDSGKAPKGIRPHLVVKVKPDWQYDDSRGTFVSSSGQAFSAMEKLPRGSTIVHVAPHLAKADPRSLSKDERNLARYVHVILPRKTTPSAYLEVVRSWPCVEEARLPPEISLPGQLVRTAPGSE